MPLQSIIVPSQAMDAKEIKPYLARVLFGRVNQGRRSRAAGCCRRLPGKAYQQNVLSSTPTNRKCQPGATEKETISEPNAAPPNMARLQTAWNRAIIDLSNNDCTPTDCAFAEMFIRLRDEPKQTRAATSSQV